MKCGKPPLSSLSVPTSEPKNNAFSDTTWYIIGQYNFPIQNLGRVGAKYVFGVSITHQSTFKVIKNKKSKILNETFLITYALLCLGF